MEEALAPEGVLLAVHWRGSDPRRELAGQGGSRHPAQAESTVLGYRRADTRLRARPLVQAVSEERRIVVVGGGPAAKAAAGAYREAGGRGEVTIIAAEGRLPYERPPLSKEYLRGEMEIDELALESSKWYRSREIDVRAGDPRRRARPRARIDVERGRASLRSSISACWRPARDPLLPDLAGVRRPQVHQIRTVGDSDRLADLDVASVLVLGSGFIGCEVAASLAMRGGDVTIASLEASPQVERLGEKVSERIAQLAGGTRRNHAGRN